MKRSIFTISTLLAGLSAVVLVVATASSLVAQTTKTTSSSSQVELEVPATTITIYGCTAPYSLVTVFRDNLTTGSVVASGSGQFSKSVAVDSFGIHNIKAYSEDDNGLRTSTISKNVSVTPQVDTLVDITLPPAISINAAVFAAGQQITFIGSSCPNIDVDLIIDNNIGLDLKTDKRGDYYATISSAGLYLGEHSFQARRFAALGGSAISQKQLFRVVESLRDNGASDTLQPGDLLPPKITAPEDNYIASSPVVTISGTAQPNVQLEILVDGHVTGSIFTNPLGEWSFEYSMVETQHSIVARACIGDYCTQPSNEVTVFYHSALGQCSFAFSFDKYRFFSQTVKSGINLELLNIDAHPPFSLLIDWGDDAVENTTLAKNKATNYHHVYHFVGLYNGIVTVTDDLGCTQTQYFSVEVVYGNATYWWILPMIAGLGAILYISRTRHEERRLRELLAKKQELEAREAVLKLNEERHKKAAKKLKQDQQKAESKAKKTKASTKTKT